MIKQTVLFAAGLSVAGAAVAQFNAPAARLNPMAGPAIKLNRPIPPRPPATMPADRVAAFLKLTAATNTATTPQTTAPQPGPTIRVSPTRLEDTGVALAFEHATVGGPSVSPNTPDGIALFDAGGGADARLVFYNPAKPLLVDCSVDSTVSYKVEAQGGMGALSTISSGTLTPVNGHAMFVVMPLPATIMTTLASPGGQSWALFSCEVTPMG